MKDGIILTQKIFMEISLIYVIRFAHGVMTIHLLSFLIGALIWFLIGFILAWFLRNKLTKEEKLNSLGKILMIFGVILLAILFIWMSFGCLIIEKDFECFVMGLFVGLPIFGSVIYGPPFVLGLVLWIMSKWGVKKTVKWLIVLLVISFVLYLGYWLINWIVDNTNYLQFLR